MKPIPTPRSNGRCGSGKEVKALKEQGEKSPALLTRAQKKKLEELTRQAKADGRYPSSAQKDDSVSEHVQGRALPRHGKLLHHVAAL